MNIVFSEPFHNSPQVEISPDGEDNKIVVTFFELDKEAGRYYFRPQVTIRASFRKMFPDDAYYWGRCFQAAYQIGCLEIPDSVEFEEVEVLRAAFKRVEELKDE